MSAAILWRVLPGLAYLDLQISPQAETRAGPRIVVVTIRHETYDRLDLEAVGGTLPRDRHAHLLRLLRKAGARAVLFDLLFTERTAYDETFRRSLSEPDPMPIALLVEASRRGMRGNDETRFFVRRPTVLPFLRPPNVLLGQSQTWDPDNVVRGVKLLIEDRELPGTFYPHLAALAVSRDHAPEIADDSVRVPGHRWTFGPADELRLRWSAPVPEFEYADALTRLEKGNDTPFQGATVIVGASDQGQRADDMHATPLGDRSGAQIIASAIRTLSEPDARQILPAPLRLEALAALLVALLTASLAVRPGLAKSLAAIGLACFGAFGLSAVALRFGSLALPSLGIATAGLVAAIVASVLGGSRLLPTWVRYRWSLREGEIAALFIDVEDSTVLLGRLKGGHRAFLESVQAAIAETVDRHGGDIERTMGDGAFAVFRRGTVTSRARACVATMRALADRFAKDAPANLDRFGVVPVLVLGAEMANVEGAVLRSRGREEFTTLGRDIAFAQRVQASAKTMETRCAIGSRLRIAVGESAGVVRLHERDLKGFEGKHPVSEIAATSQRRGLAASDPL